MPHNETPFSPPRLIPAEIVRQTFRALPRLALAILGAALLMSTVNLLFWKQFPTLREFYLSSEVESTALINMLTSITWPWKVALVMVAIQLMRSKLRFDMASQIAPFLRPFGILCVLSVVFGLLHTTGLILLVIPGLYIAARFSVMVPLLLFEDAEWNAMHRSMELTKDSIGPLMLLICGASVTVGVLFHGVFTAHDLVVGSYDYDVFLVDFALRLIEATAAAGVWFVYQKLRELQLADTDALAKVFE